MTSSREYCSTAFPVHCLEECGGLLILREAVARIERVVKLPALFGQFLGLAEQRCTVKCSFFKSDIQSHLWRKVDISARLPSKRIFSHHKVLLLCFCSLTVKLSHTNALPPLI